MRHIVEDFLDALGEFIDMCDYNGATSSKCAKAQSLAVQLGNAVHSAVSSM